LCWGAQLFTQNDQSQPQRLFGTFVQAVGLDVVSPISIRFERHGRPPSIEGLPPPEPTRRRSIRRSPQQDVAEFEYRFNRRYDLAAMLPRLATAALQTPPMPYRLLKLAEVPA
jgi:hypothetical protein